MRFTQHREQRETGGGLCGRIVFDKPLSRDSPKFSPVRPLESTRNRKEIRKKRAVFRPAKNETIMMRGTNGSAPDLVCGSCGAILAVGISSHNLRMAIACNRCDAVNETITKQHTDDAAS